MVGGCVRERDRGLGSLARRITESMYEQTPKREGKAMRYPKKERKLEGEKERERVNVCVRVR